MDEVPIYGRHGKAVYRLCGNVFYDFLGKPRGFLVGKTIYDLKRQHRGFYVRMVVRDRMGKVVGYAEDARVEGLQLPFVDIPPVPYRNLPAPELPTDLADLECPALPPLWSVMRLENLLV
ncbi:MAG: 4-fold beta flower protein [candidate division WOR-3 bacterium]